MVLEFFFWAAILIVFYSYIGYGIVLALLVTIKKKLSVAKTGAASFSPEVTLIIPAYNEAEHIRVKIKNCYELNYPKDKLKIIFVADGSTDETVNILKEYGDVTVMFSPERRGKIAAINRTMKHVSTPFVVFCDANTHLNKNAINELVKHFQDPVVGAVAGEKKVISEGSTDAAGAGEGLYWKYESSLKKLDSAFYSVVGAAGELFAIRTELYEEVPENALLDDFIISMKICARGYRVVYEPGAYASEPPSFSMKEEQKRKIRISAGGFQSVIWLKELLNIFKYGRLSFQYISHRVLRWIVCPFLLPLILLLNTLLINSTGENTYKIILFLQVIFYILAVAGWVLASKNMKVKALYIPYYFVFMNVAVYIGLNKYLRNTQSVLWDKAKRKS